MFDSMLNIWIWHELLQNMTWSFEYLNETFKSNGLYADRKCSHWYEIRIEIGILKSFPRAKSRSIRRPNSLFSSNDLRPEWKDFSRIRMRHPNIDSLIWRKCNSDLMIIATINIFRGTESTIHQNCYLFIQTFLLYVCPHFSWMIRSTGILDKNRFVKRSANSIMDSSMKSHKEVLSI